MTHTFDDNGQLYTWEPVLDRLTLYGRTVAPASLIPDGMVMTLCDLGGAVLMRLRGERHADRIAFVHVTRVGEIGAWVLEDTEDEIPATGEIDAWMF